MAKRDTVEIRLAEIAALRDAPKGEDVLRALRDALASKVHLIVAKAASVAAHHGAGELADDLARTFTRFMQKPETTDKGCAAKTAIASALYEMGLPAETVFVAGIHHVQLEASWGKPVDTAAELRGASALGLVRMGYRDMLVELAELLADPEPVARMAAARALAYTASDLALPLLRLKARLGDGEPQVTGECLSAMVRISAPKSVEFLRRFLDSTRDDDVRDAALTALGESRHPAAFELMKNRWQNDFDPRFRAALVTPLALLRLPQAVDFLIDVLDRTGPALALSILGAMQMYRHDAAVRVRVLAAAEASDSAEVRAEGSRLFGA